MAIVVGSAGKVKIGANAVAQVTSFRFNYTAETAEAVVLGDTHVQRAAGIKSLSGTVSCLFDRADTNGQEAMGAGAAVTLDLLAEGDTSGDKRYQVPSIINDEGVEVGGNDEYVVRSFGFLSSGNVTVDTIV